MSPVPMVVLCAIDHEYLRAMTSSEQPNAEKKRTKKTNMKEYCVWYK